MKRYEVVITYNTGQVARLSHRDRMEWCKRTAEKHAKDVRASSAIRHFTKVEVKEV